MNDASGESERLGERGCGGTAQTPSHVTWAHYLRVCGPRTLADSPSPSPIHTMFPLLGNEKRRRINLGGVNSASSHAAIVNQAKALRSERQNSRKRLESVIRIQAWFRGVHQSRAVRQQLRSLFDQDVLSITGLRCLVLIGRDQAVLGQWSAAILNGGQGATSRCLH